MLYQFCQFGHQIKVIVGKDVGTMIVFKNRIVALWVTWLSQEEVTLARLFIINMRKVIVVLQERTFRMMDDTSTVNQNFSRNFQNLWHFKEFSRWNFTRQNSLRCASLLSPEVNLTTASYHSRSIVDGLK